MTLIKEPSFYVKKTTGVGMSTIPSFGYLAPHPGPLYESRRSLPHRLTEEEMKVIVNNGHRHQPLFGIVYPGSTPPDRKPEQADLPSTAIVDFVGQTGASGKPLLREMSTAEKWRRIDNIINFLIGLVIVAGMLITILIIVINQPSNPTPRRRHQYQQYQRYRTEAHPMSDERMSIRTKVKNR